MSTSSLLSFNIDNDLVYGNTHFVEEGATFNWEIALMSDVRLYNGTGTSSFKTITFTTNSDKNTQVLLGFNVLDRNGNVLSQIGANGRLRILEIYDDANYGTNNRLKQYDGKKVQLTDTRYAQFVESRVDTTLNRFQLSIIPTEDLILEPVVSNVGYSVSYECTAVTCEGYTLDEPYQTYSDSYTKSYNNRLTCMSYDIDIPDINWSTYYFTVLGYYDGNTHISSYCPDKNSETIYYTLDHWAHNQNGGEVANSIDYKYENKCERKADYWCSYCTYSSEKYYDTYHEHSTESKFWLNDDIYHWHNICCDRCGKVTDTTEKVKHVFKSDGDDEDSNHRCQDCDHEAQHDWGEKELVESASDCDEQKYIIHCKDPNCKQGRYEWEYKDLHDWNGWQWGTSKYKNKYNTGKLVHIKYRTCKKCYNAYEDKGLDVDYINYEGEQYCQYGGWLDANKSKTGCDVVRFCPCGNYETHTHSKSSCWQEYGNNLGGTEILKNAEYCIDGSGVVCMYRLTVVAYKNKCKVTEKDLDIITGTATFSDKTTHDGDDNAFEEEMKRIANAIGNTFGATAEDKFPSTCKWCGNSVLKPYLLKVVTNGRVQTVRNNSWILQSKLTEIDNNNKGIFLGRFFVGIGGYAVMLY